MHVDSLAKIRADIIHDRDLPTVPAVVARVLALTESESASPRELIDVVQADQALTARILRVANSSFFAFSRQANTLQRAMVVLGFETVRDLTLGIKVWDAFLERDRPTLLTLWRHAAGVAVAARSLARKVGGIDPGSAFTCGLLHDIGRAVLHLRVPNAMARLALADGEDAPEREQEILGVDHTTVGVWMAESWSLPDAIVQAIRDHHEADAAASPGPAGVVALADALERLVAGRAAPPDAPALDRDDCDALAATSPLSAAEWHEAAERVRREGDELAAVFGRGR